MKQDWTLYIWKLDRRTKRGERLFSTTVWTGRDREGMEREVRELLLSGLYTVDQFRFEYVPVYSTVKNLMTGQEVQIRTEDRGGPCDPSMERYWSM